LSLKLTIYASACPALDANIIKITPKVDMTNQGFYIFYIQS